MFSSKHPGLYRESPDVAVCGGVFPAVGVNVHRLQVALDDVLVVEQGSADFPGTVAQFSVENVTRQSIGFHAVHMAQPAEASLHEYRRNAHEAGSLEDVCVWDPLLPSYVQQAAERAEVVAVEASLLSGIHCPRLAAIGESTGRKLCRPRLLSFHSAGYCSRLACSVWP